MTNKTLFDQFACNIFLTDEDNITNYQQFHKTYNHTKEDNRVIHVFETWDEMNKFLTFVTNNEPLKEDYSGYYPSIEPWYIMTDKETRNIIGYLVMI